MFTFRELPMIVTYDYAQKRHKFYSVHLNMNELFNWQEKVNFTGMIGLINPKDPSFFTKLKQAKNIILLKLVHRETEQASPASKCVLTDFLFETGNCLRKKFNVNLLVPLAHPEDFVPGGCLVHLIFRKNRLREPTKVAGKAFPFLEIHEKAQKPLKRSQYPHQSGQNSQKVFRVRGDCQPANASLHADNFQRGAQEGEQTRDLQFTRESKNRHQPRKQAGAARVRLQSETVTLSSKK